MEFIGLKSIAKDVVFSLNKLEPDSFYNGYPLNKWKMSDGIKDVGEVNEVVQFLVDDRIYTCLEFRHFDEDPVYVFEWESKEV